MTRDPALALVSALYRDRGGVAVVYYPEMSDRTWMVKDVQSLLPPIPAPVITQTLFDCLDSPNAPCLLVPRNEAETVMELDGSRELFIATGRTQPVVLFLLRDGDGAKALKRAPSIASWLRGSDPDPELLAEEFGTSVDEFQKAHQQTPSGWIRQWREDGCASDPETLAIAYLALAIAGVEPNDV